MAAPKFVTFVGGVFQRVVAAIIATPDAIVATGADGKIDVSFMPAGIGADTKLVQASEALASGDFINLHVVSGAIRMRKADASTGGKDADGFVLASVASGASGTAYMRGINNSLSGLTPGEDYFLSTTVAGGVQDNAPSANGQASQRLGKALSSTELAFSPGTPAVQLVS